MADQYAPDLPPAAPLDGSEVMYLVQGGNSRRATSADIANIQHDHEIADVAGLQAALDDRAPATGEGLPYDIPVAFPGTPSAGQLLGLAVIPTGRTVEIAADFAGAAGGAPVANPTADYAIDIQNDGASIGTVTIGTGGAFTFVTAGNTAKTIAGGSVISAIGADPADGTLDGVFFTLAAVLGAVA